MICDYSLHSGTYISCKQLSLDGLFISYAPTEMLYRRGRAPLLYSKGSLFSRRRDCSDIFSLFSAYSKRI